MPEEQVVAPETNPSEVPPDETPTESAPQPTALTLDQVRESLLPEFSEKVRQEITADLKRDLKAAYDTSRRAENKADVYRQRQDRYIQSLENRLDQVATQNMEEQAAKIWRLERERERDKTLQIEEQQPSLDYDKAQAEFHVFAQAVARSEGINVDDPKLNEFFENRSRGSQDSADWRMALGLAVADYRRYEAVQVKTEAARVKAESDKARGDTSTREKAIREDERAKAKNEKRAEAGPVDRGQPAAEPPTKDWMRASDEDVLKEMEKRRQASQNRKMGAY